MAKSDTLHRPSFSASRIGNLLVVVGRPGPRIPDDDWRAYIEWIREIQADTLELGLLLTPGSPPPSSEQRALFNRELQTRSMKVAIMLSDPKLVAIVRVVSWMTKGAQPFRAHELKEALAYLGETDVARVRDVIRELGGVLPLKASS